MRAFGRHCQRGQSLVEFTMILPVVLTLAFAIADFGVAFGTNMTLIQATREGARVGAILVNGAKSLGCSGATGEDSVDPQIIAAVQRAIESPGSGITVANIDWIHIYKSDSTGRETAFNEWKRDTAGTTICGVKLDFVEKSVGWKAADRLNTLPVESIGVRMQYHYKLFTPLSAITGLFGLNEIMMVDSTVMALEP